MTPGQDIKIYIATHRRRVMMLDDPGYIPIQCGKALTTDDFAPLGDNSGDNISSLNPYFNEMTAIYWMIKNPEAQADILGLAHYRRYFVTQTQSTVIEGHTVAASTDFSAVADGDLDMIVAEPIGFLNPKTDAQISLEENYFGTAFGFDIFIARQAVEKVDPDYLAAFDFAMRNCHLIPFNMFVGRKSVVQDYADWIFPVLFLLNDWLPFRSYTPDYQLRAIAFLAERLFTVWIVKNRRQYKIGHRHCVFCPDL